MDIKIPEQPEATLRGQGTVTEWFNGRSVFITGASGFMGKVLLEKLLYQCTGLKHIYIMLRSKRGRTPDQRIEDMWKLPMFHRVRKHGPEAFKKVVLFHGDVLTEGLGLSDSEREEIIENVSVIFHCAATLKLEAELKDAIEMNTEGTVKVLELAKMIKNLKVFIHLSTAFCSADIPEFKEKVYPTADNPKDIIQVTKWLPRDALIKATPAIIAPHPNTYTYSKRLAETLIEQEYPNLPLVIVRPSIVVPSALEPLPGWVDSLNGPMGLLVGCGKGVIRSFHANPKYRAQVVPVDVAISAIIVSAWKMGSADVKPKEIPVYNLTNDGVVTMTWGEVLTLGRDIGYANPFEGQIWYPDGDIRTSKFMHRLCCIFFHWIPAYLIDFLMLLFRQKRFMVRLMKRIDDGLELLQFFTLREWIFESKHFLALNSEISPLDKQIYRIDFEALPIKDYFVICILGARQYLMKEDLSTIPRCRKVQSILYVVDRAFALSFYLGLIWMLYSYFDNIKDTFDVMGSILQNTPIIGSLIPTSDNLS